MSLDININVKISASDGLIALLTALTSSTHSQRGIHEDSSSRSMPVDASAEPKPTSKKKASEPKLEAVEEEPVEVIAPKIEHTMEQLKELLTKAAANNVTTVPQFLKSFGAKRLSEIDTSKYDEMFAQLTELTNDLPY